MNNALYILLTVFLPNPECQYEGSPKPRPQPVRIQSFEEETLSDKNIETERSMPEFDPPVLLPELPAALEEQPQDNKEKFIDDPQKEILEQSIYEGSEEEDSDLSIKLRELHDLLKELEAQIKPAFYKDTEAEESQEPENEGFSFPQAPEGPAVTIIQLKTYSHVTGSYVRVIDAVDFVEDPEGIGPFLGSIIICPAPEMGRYITVSRALIKKRLKEHGIPLSKVIFTGPSEVLVLRVKAQGEDKKKEEEQSEDFESRGVEKDKPVKIVRLGRLFRIEEWGKALESGEIGETIKVKDRKGRILYAKVTGPETVNPVDRGKER